jgi:hypothetical protein
MEKIGNYYFKYFKSNHNFVFQENRQILAVHKLLKIAQQNDHKIDPRPEPVLDAVSGESSVYLCGECSIAFTSIDECNEHVLRVRRIFICLYAYLNKSGSSGANPTTSEFTL